MASQAQIEANRRNSQKSTGPATVAGKAVSSLNALKTGAYAESTLIIGEDAATLDDLARDYAATCRPVGPREQAAVDALIYADWLLRRMRRVETLIWNDQIEDLQSDKETNHEPEWYSAIAWGRTSGRFDMIQRRLAALERSYHRALADLERLQAKRPPAPEPDPSPEPAEAVSPQIGFVPSPIPPAVESNPLPLTPAIPAARFSPTLGHMPQPKPLQNPTGAENHHRNNAPAEL